MVLVINKWLEFRNLLSGLLIILSLKIQQPFISRLMMPLTSRLYLFNCNFIFSVFAIDMRGYGLTDKPSSVKDYQIKHLVNDIKGFLDALGEECWNACNLIKLIGTQFI